MNTMIKKITAVAVGISFLTLQGMTVFAEPENIEEAAKERALQPETSSDEETLAALVAQLNGEEADEKATALLGDLTFALEDADGMTVHFDADGLAVLPGDASADTDVDAEGKEDNADDKKGDANGEKEDAALGRTDDDTAADESEEGEDASSNTDQFRAYLDSLLDAGITEVEATYEAALPDDLSALLGDGVEFPGPDEYIEASYNGTSFIVFCQTNRVFADPSDVNAWTSSDNDAGDFWRYVGVDGDGVLLFTADEDGKITYNEEPQAYYDGSRKMFFSDEELTIPFTGLAGLLDVLSQEDDTAAVLEKVEALDFTGMRFETEVVERENDLSEKENEAQSDSTDERQTEDAQADATPEAETAESENDEELSQTEQILLLDHSVFASDEPQSEASGMEAAAAGDGIAAENAENEPVSDPAAIAPYKIGQSASSELVLEDGTQLVPGEVALPGYVDYVISNASGELLFYADRTGRIYLPMGEKISFDGKYFIPADKKNNSPVITDVTLPEEEQKEKTEDAARDEAEQASEKEEQAQENTERKADAADGEANASGSETGKTQTDGASEKAAERSVQDAQNSGAGENVKAEESAGEASTAGAAASP